MRRTHHPKKCKFCGKVFLPRRSKSLYCSRKCYYEGRKRDIVRRYVKIAAHLGLTISQVRSRLARLARKQIPLDDYKDDHKYYNKLSAAPKPYWMIKQENRCRRVQSGWRGQPVIGGGRGINTNAPLTPAEMQANCRWRY